MHDRNLRQLILVHTRWQDSGHVHAKHCNLAITDAMPVFLYCQHGRTRISREPLLPVRFHSNQGIEHGVASARDLAAAGVPLATVARGVSEAHLA